MSTPYSKRNTATSSSTEFLRSRYREGNNQGVTKRCRLSWLTNSGLVNEPKYGGEGGVAGSQPMSTAVHRSQNKLWRSNYIFNLWRKRKERRGSRLMRLFFKTQKCSNFLVVLAH